MMFDKTTIRSDVVCAAGVAGLLLAGAAGCSIDGDATGRVELPVSAIGGDGATYRFPAGTVLEVRSSELAADLPMDGDEPALEVELPIGSYQAQLAHPDGYTTSWPLVRSTVDGEEVAPAELITPMPMPFSIAEDQTTALALLLRVNEVGDVVFSTGTLQTSVTVETASGPAAYAFFAGSYQPKGASFDGASAELQSRLTFGDGVSLPFLIDAHLTGAWTPTGLASVCAPVMASAAWAEAHAGWMDLVAELVGGTGAMCLDGAVLTLYVRRDGEPRSALALELAGDHGFWINLRGTLPAAPYDGETLRLSSLATTTALAGGFLDVGIDTVPAFGAPATRLFQSSGGSSSVSLQLAP